MPDTPDAPKSSSKALLLEPSKPQPGEADAKPKKTFGQRVFKALTVLTLIVIGVGTLALGGAFYSYHLFSAEPEHWAANRAMLEKMTKQEKAVAAGNVEKRFLAGLSDDAGVTVLYNEGAERGRATPISHPLQKPAGRGESDIQLSVRDANVWFDQRFDEWVGSRGVSMPSQIGKFMLTAEDSTPVLAFDFAYEDKERGLDVNTVVSLTLDHRFYDDGRMSLRIADVRGGELPLPFEQIVGRLTEQFGDKLSGEHASFMNHVVEGTPFHPTIPVDKVRVRRLVGLGVQGDKVAMRFRTEFKKGYKPKPQELAAQRQQTASAE